MSFSESKTFTAATAVLSHLNAAELLALKEEMEAHYDYKVLHNPLDTMFHVLNAYRDFLTGDKNQMQDYLQEPLTGFDVVFRLRNSTEIPHTLKHALTFIAQKLNCSRGPAHVFTLSMDSSVCYKNYGFYPHEPYLTLEQLDEAEQQLPAWAAEQEKAQAA